MPPPKSGLGCGPTRRTHPAVDLIVILTVFGIVFLAELPDKTALASLVLGTRYRPSHVFVGTAAAFLVHVVLAILAGSLLTLLPGRLLHAVVGALFLMGAILLLRGRHDEAEEEEELKLRGDKPATFRRVAGMSFGVILVAEFGDLTQIVTANLAAKYHDPISVGIGATLGLWAVAGLAIVGGRGLLKVVPITVITRVAAGIMGVLAVISIVEAIRG
ncbi:TMEM165/GDT1 family protein [Catenulispora sp. GP43]|uniref:TMEM165/GDT1 family protein n=1 Tax=Catenulispora sp. GP43 TaxID=3156263 RepID=UPI0035160E09